MKNRRIRREPENLISELKNTSNQEEEFEVTRASSYQRFPAIYENLVIWEEHRNERCNSGWDIYCYDLLTSEEFRITTDRSDNLFHESTSVRRERRLRKSSRILRKGQRLLPGTR
jgi:beta propeller repeat protein